MLIHLCNMWHPVNKAWSLICSPKHCSEIWSCYSSIHPKLQILKTKGSSESGNKWSLIWSSQNLTTPATPLAWNWGATEGKISRPSKRTAAMITSRSWLEKRWRDLNYPVVWVVWVVWVWRPFLGTFMEVCVHIQQKVKILNVSFYLLLQFFRCKMPYSCSAAALGGIHSEPLEVKHFNFFSGEDMTGWSTRVIGVQFNMLQNARLKYEFSHVRKLYPVVAGRHTCYWYLLLQSNILSTYVPMSYRDVCTSDFKEF